MGWGVDALFTTPQRTVYSTAVCCASTTMRTLMRYNNKTEPAVRKAPEMRALAYPMSQRFRLLQAAFHRDSEISRRASSPRTGTSKFQGWMRECGSFERPEMRPPRLLYIVMR